MICKTANWSQREDSCFFSASADEKHEKTGHSGVCMLNSKTGGSREAWFCEECKTTVCFGKHPKEGDAKPIAAQIRSEMPFLMVEDAGAVAAGFLPRAMAPLTLAPREIPFLPQHQKALDHIDGCFAVQEDIKSITESIVKKQLGVRNRPFKLGDMVEFRPCENINGNKAKPIASSDRYYGIVCRVPPPGGSGTFVTDLLCQSHVVRITKVDQGHSTAASWVPSLKKATKPDVGEVGSFVPVFCVVKQSMRLHKEGDQAGDDEGGGFGIVSTALSTRFVKMLGDAVRFSANPLSAALATSFACAELGESRGGLLQAKQAHELLAVSTKFGHIAYELVDSVKTEEHDKVLLPKKGDNRDKQDEPALEVALMLQDTKFARHPNCEDHVNKVWKNGYSVAWDKLQFGKSSDVFDYTAAFKTLLKNVEALNDIDFILSPVMRFFTTFVLFAILIALQHTVVGVWGQGIPTVETSPDALTGAEVAFIVVSVGFLLSEMEEVWDAYTDGIMNKYLQDGWNIIDWALHTVFLAYVGRRAIGLTYDKGTPESAEGVTHAIRILSFSCILLWLRLMNVMTVVSRLGTLIRMISLMAKDIAIFLVLLFMYVIGFAGTFKVWFGHVADAGAKDDESLRMEILGAVNSSVPGVNLPFAENPDKDLEQAGYKTLMNSMQTLFSAAMGDFTFTELRAEHTFFGPALLLIFVFVGAIMLLNLLIAMLSDIYQRVQNGAREEFAFSNAKTVASNRLMWCGQKTAIPLPAPLNLLTCWQLPFIKIFKMFKGESEPSFPIYAFSNALILVALSSLFSGCITILVMLFSNLKQIFAGFGEIFSRVSEWLKQRMNMNDSHDVTGPKWMLFMVCWLILVIVCIPMMILVVVGGAVLNFACLPFFIVRAGEIKCHFLWPALCCCCPTAATAAVAY
jgi:hypothetical protein